MIEMECLDEKKELAYWDRVICVDYIEVERGGNVKTKTQYTYTLKPGYNKPQYNEPQYS